ncbi:MAG: phosphate/phosphite/phosphonate ABC transporter substrate-binding protein [Opitutaceae bacterium]
MRDGIAWLRFQALSALAFVVACQPTTVRQTGKAQERPPPLRLGYTPSEEIVADREAAAIALAGYIERELDQDVEVVRTARYGTAVEAMRRGEIDLMPLGPFAYVLASARGLAEAVAVTGHDASGPRRYASMIVAHRRTGIRKLDELPARAAALRLNFTDPASNSGHLAPRARLTRLGLDPDADFARCAYTRSHSVALFNMLFDEADVAGVSRSTWLRLVEKNRLPPEEFFVLWESDPMPNGPMAIRASAPAKVKISIQEALAALDEREPATWRKVVQQYEDGTLVYLPCDDSLYDGVRALVSAAELPEAAGSH